MSWVGTKIFWTLRGGGGGRGYENFLDVDLQTNILNLNISVSRGVRTSNFANIMWENITKSYGKGAKNRKTFL